MNMSINTAGTPTTLVAAIENAAGENPPAPSMARATRPFCDSYLYMPELTTSRPPAARPLGV